MKKVAVILASLILAICVGCTPKAETVNADTLLNETLYLGNPVNVQFDEIDDDLTATGFDLIPNKGEIKVVYLSGEYDSVELFLCNSDNGEQLQTAVINKANKKIAFTNLDGAKKYFIEFRCLGVNDGESALILEFQQ